MIKLLCLRLNHIYEELPCRYEETSNNAEKNIYEEIQTAKDHQEIEIKSEMSPTADDTVYNRYFQFLLYTITEFMQKACLAILVSTNKSNAKTSKFYKYLNKAVDVGVTGGISAIPGAAPIAKGAGKVAGEFVEGIVKEYKQSEQHKKAKLTEHLLTTFQPDDPRWISFLLDGFSSIFIS